MMKYYSTTLLVFLSILTIVAPAHSQEVRLDLGSVLNGIFSPPHRAAEIKAKADIEQERLRQQADIEQARITAEASKNVDRVSPILTQWGVYQVNCAPGVAFINGLSVDTICINPTGSILAGYYSYSPDRQLLVRVDTHNAPTPAPTVVQNVNSANATLVGQNRGF
jgi:hypothetical protein